MSEPHIVMPLAPGRYPRVLYLTFDVGFLNPTRKLLLDVLRRVTDLRIHGPGYVDGDELDRGVRHLVEVEGPFDFVICDEYVLQNFDTSKPESIRFVNHACLFDRHLLIKALEWREFLKTYDGMRIITLMQSDYYNFPEIQIERLETLADYYICWGPEFLMSRSAITPFEAPYSGPNKRIFDTWNDSFRDFTLRNADRIISCPQFVGSGEAGGGALTLRPSEWAVLGADYNARVLARERIDAAGMERAGKWMPQAFAIAGRLNINVYSKYWAIAIIQWGFRHALRQSKYAFTCGSVLRWPIRKFFEIPINGAVLVCEPPHGFEALGFRDRVNAVVCDAKDILGANEWLIADQARAQEIATAGQDLVLRKHSVEARARQIGSSLQRIVAGSFSGSRWREGEFELL
ncbi:MAG: glycosyltransferase family 1 protein [Lysobacterales bacterium]|nr:MAG: glycosyltransferase family 1 protein [Xanthomonadales bacterium]